MEQNKDGAEQGHLDEGGHLDVFTVCLDVLCVLPGWRMNVNAKLVVPLLLIGEHLIGLRHLLEILLRELLVFARVFVRVVLDGELLVRCAQRQHTDSA